MLGQKQAAINASLTSGLSNITQGMCVSIDWSNRLAVINVGGGEVAVPMFIQAPFPGDPVWVAFLGQRPVCLGPIPKAPTGTVQGTPSSGKITVTGDDGAVYTVPYLGDAPASGSRVVMLWAADGAALGAMSSESDKTEPEVPPSAGDGGLRKATFQPTDSGTWNASSGWYSREVACSSSEVGAYFYGNVIADTIPDGATVTSVRVYISEIFNRYPSSLATIGTHPAASKSGGVSASNVQNVPGGSGWKSLTAAIGNALKTGAGKGLATDHGGWHKWAAAGRNNSGAIYMEWR